MDEVDVVVVGAGVVGLAVARQLALRGREVLILEAAGRFGTGASARNSEVIHAGIYYPRGSLKARLCVAGRDELYRFCAERGIPHRRCGKLIVATSDGELEGLTRIAAASSVNGVELARLEGAAVRALEPQLSCAAALDSPLTGIIDSQAYMLALLADAERHGATLVCGSAVTRVVLGGGTMLIGVNGAQCALRARALVNCAGVDSPALARRMEGLAAAHIPVAHFAKGNYFTLKGRAPFERLIYPLPQADGLGIHLTLDLAGRARFGPDVQWVGSGYDYGVDESRAAAFYTAIRRYWPALRDGTLEAAYAGVRPRISAPGEPLADFRIDDAGTHGVPGLVNLFGIESPGLTASLAIASEVATRL
ncbi:MAG TPA: NAD(P)/FAD-dependent oxidoreductase [Steroidobacteraceae bacterium]|nr:NAD(P)/FAD-dependent oxidoreductase [Steroidobacteraceae bacterium]